MRTVGGGALHAFVHFVEGKWLYFMVMNIIYGLENRLLLLVALVESEETMTTYCVVGVHYLEYVRLGTAGG